MWREPSRNLGLGVSSVCRLQAKCKRAHLQHGTCDSAVGLNVRDGTCAVRLTPPAVAACHATIATDSTATVLRGVVRFRTACDAQRSEAFPQAVVRCNMPHSVPLRSAYRGTVLSGNRCNGKRTFDAGCKLPQPTCNRHSCSGQHPARTIQRTTHTEGKQEKTACSVQHTAETMQEM